MNIWIRLWIVASVSWGVYIIVSFWEGLSPHYFLTHRKFQLAVWFMETFDVGWEAPILYFIIIYWILTSLFVLGLGYTVRWVIHGFKP